MTLLITVFVAMICSVFWYSSEKARKLKIGTLCLMYWGASLMWLVDAVVEYLEAGAEYFVPAAADMLNDGFLGPSVVAFGMIIWLAAVMIKDPNGVVRSALLKSGK